MEKYLRLLNPKTTNFESIGGGSHGSITAQDVCAALSYAKLSPVQDLILRMAALNQNDINFLRESIEPLLKHVGRIRVESLDLRPVGERDVQVVVDDPNAMFIALVEFCKVPADYKPSERNRAAIGGVSRMQIQRKLNPLIDHYKRMLESEFAIATNKINIQFLKITN